VKKFRVRYRCVLEPDEPAFSTVLYAYDREHAEDLFFDDTNDNDWTIVSIRKVT
jgi:hypothetical protein